MTVIVHHGDSRDVLKTLADASLDACVTDPPYALVSITKRWNKPGMKQWERGDGSGSGVYKRATSGFMGQAWDTGETAFDPAFWAEVFRVLKPGAHVVAFGGTRSYHRLACAIEDAGFEIRDSLLDIVAADTGAAVFMASLNDEQRAAFSKCLDESQFGGMLAWVYGTGFPKSHDVAKGIDKALGASPLETGAYTRAGIGRNCRSGNDIVGSSTIEAETRVAVTAPSTEEGARWQGFGTALKPAFEPIVLARKPLDGTVAANVLKHGTGALNIDGCRIGWRSEADAAAAAAAANGFADSRAKGTVKQSVSIGKESRDGVNRYDPKALAGRWPANVVHDGSEDALSGFPREAGAASPVTGAESPNSFPGVYSGPKARVPGPFHGDAGGAARFFYGSKADKGDRLGSKHPTVKPVDLMRWLVRLVTPPGGTVLDPFAGSGSTGMACLAEGFDAVLIEREVQFVADIRRRIDHVSGADAPLFAALTDDPHTETPVNRAQTGDSKPTEGV